MTDTATEPQGFSEDSSMITASDAAMYTSDEAGSVQGSDQTSDQNGEQGETGQQTPEQQAAEQNTPADKPMSRAEKRIHQLHAEKMQYQQQLQDLQAQLNQQQPQTGDKPPVEPKMEDYADDDIDSYFSDHTNWVRDMAKFEAVQQFQQQQQQQAEQQRQFEYQQRASEIDTALQQAVQVNPELKQVLQDAFARDEHTQIPVDWAATPMPAELTVKVFEHIGKDADLHYKLAQMTPEQATFEVAMLAGRLSNQTNKQAPVVTKAKAPPQHTQTNTPAARGAADMSDDEFLEQDGLQ